MSKRNRRKVQCHEIFIVFYSILRFESLWFPGDFARELHKNDSLVFLLLKSFNFTSRYSCMTECTGSSQWFPQFWDISCGQQLEKHSDLHCPLTRKRFRDYYFWSKQHYFYKNITTKPVIRSTLARQTKFSSKTARWRAVLPLYSLEFLFAPLDMRIHIAELLLCKKKTQSWTWKKN